MFKYISFKNFSIVIYLTYNKNKNIVIHTHKNSYDFIIKNNNKSLNWNY